MDLLLHPPDDGSLHRPAGRGRLSTVGHGTAFRAFARAAKKAGVRFMVIGGTFRDVAVRAASTRDIDVVLIDRQELPAEAMRAAGFTRAPHSAHAWHYAARGRIAELRVAAVASSAGPGGPFSTAFQHAETRVIEGIKVPVPRIEDYVILKLLAAVADRRRFAPDLLDVQYALEAYPESAGGPLSVPALRARLRDLYGIRGDRLKRLLTLLRHVRRQLGN